MKEFAKGKCAVGDVIVESDGEECVIVETLEHVFCYTWFGNIHWEVYTVAIKDGWTFKEEPDTYKPEEGEKYWYVDEYGDATCKDFYSHKDKMSSEIDLSRSHIGNIYRTHDEAIEASQRVIKAYKNE